MTNKKTPFIIVEGMDRCGKSTLVSSLAMRFKSAIVHHSSKPPRSLQLSDQSFKFDSLLWELSNYRELTTTFKELSKSDKHTIICDRFHLGVSVYGQKYRGYPIDISPSMVEHEIGLQNTDAILIMLIDNIDEIVKRDDGMSHETSHKEWEDTRKNFIDCYRNSNLSLNNKILIDVTQNGGFERTLSSVLERLIYLGY